MDATITTVAVAITRGEKINTLLLKDKITLPDIEQLSVSEKEYLGRICTKRLSRLKGEERASFLDKIDSIMPASNKVIFWEHNHSNISRVISVYMDEYGTMPTREYIADKTGLSRQTVAKHVKEYAHQPIFQAEMQQFKMLSNRVLAKVYALANRGDLKAAKLYFEIVGTLNKQQQPTVVTEQNNHIQINNTLLSQQNLKQLSAEQLNQIEGIINGDKSKVLSLESGSLSQN